MSPTALRRALGLLILCGNFVAAARADDDASIEIKDYGALQGIDDGEFSLGNVDKCFFILDQWEWNRCKRFIPKLPQVDTASNMLVVLIVYDKWPLAFQGVERDDDQLVISTQLPPLTPMTADYRPPKFHVIRLPAWSGPIRFEINGHPQFTVPSEGELDAKVDQLWEEILRIHSGGRLTLSNQLRYLQQQHIEPFSEDELTQIKSRFLKTKDRPLVDPGPVYDVLFRDLTKLKAKSVVPRIFKLIDAMGQHDKAFEPAWKTLVGIGGDEVVEGCRRAVKSENRRSRFASVLILRDLAVPETRPLAHKLLMGTDIQLVRASLPLLQRLGLCREDVPALIKSVERLEARLFKGAASGTSLDSASSDDINSVLYALGSLGPDAEEALPMLERIADGAGYTSLTKTPEVAQEMIERIQARIN